MTDRNSVQGIAETQYCYGAEHFLLNIIVYCLQKAEVHQCRQTAKSWDPQEISQ